MEALLTAWMIGLAPMESVTVPFVGTVQPEAEPFGLQTPMTTEPPGPLGANRPARTSVELEFGTMTVKVMCEESITVDRMLGSGVNVKVEPEPVTMPTLVFCDGSVLTTKPVPRRVTGNCWPIVELVGRLAGVIPVADDPGAVMV